jgi:bifunctional UDP-N-acetylglucosamine pyrophosphorylase / glucosamine-1-phosphate N-acetyltransferase
VYHPRRFQFPEVRMKNAAVVILAAGQGKRMQSAAPKVLHRAAGAPLVAFPMALARELKASRVVVVVGHGRDAVRAAVSKLPGGAGARFAVQEEQRGTGHAVMAALPELEGHDGPVLILSGDVPLLEKSSVAALHRAYAKARAKIAFIEFVPGDPSGYGRVVRDAEGAVVGIREDRDCSREEKRIEQVNSGIYVVDADFLRKGVRKLEADNDQGELYLTDLVAMAAKRGAVPVVEAPPDEVLGVNDREDLARVEAIVTARRLRELLLAGVTMHRPGTIQVELSARVGRDVELGAGVELRGATEIGDGCRIEAGAIVIDSKIEEGATIKAYSVLEGAVVGAGAIVGPFARLRPGARLAERVHVGNFVEVKNTRLGEGSKANHLAYLGDGEIGAGVNVGAGTIFCNYDGFSKHLTVLEDGVFIGSDSQLVAPVRVGKGAYVASGSTITKDVPPDALAIARGRQENKENVAPALRRLLLAKKQRADEEKAGQKGKKR